MTVNSLNADIKGTGIGQGDLVILLQNIVDTVNELVDDHGTNKTTIDECRTAIIELIDDHASMVTELTAIGTTLADYKAIYDAHTHECPGSSFAASRCSTPDTGAAENSLVASAASAFTDTSGGSVPATLTAGDPTASAAALSDTTDLTLNKG